METTIYKQTKREKDLLRQGHSPIGGSSEGLIMQILPSVHLWMERVTVTDYLTGIYQKIPD